MGHGKESGRRTGPGSANGRSRGQKTEILVDFNHTWKFQPNRLSGWNGYEEDGDATILGFAINKCGVP